jgi:hypothetical protein
MVMISRLRHIRIWTIAGLLAAATLRCGDDVQPTTPTDMEMAGGDGQNGIPGQPLPSPLVVLVTDASGNPVPGVAVQWAAQGGGSVSATSTTTGSNGRASVQRVLGTDLGQQTTTATSAGLDGSPVTFVAVAVEAGAPASIALITSPPAQPLDGEVFDPAAQPAVEVKDAAGVLLPNVQVTASIASGSGTLEGITTATTNGSGVATFGDLGIRGVGSHSLRFTAGAATVSSGTIELSPLSEAATRGSWGPVVSWDIVPLHMNLLPNGKVFAWGKRERNVSGTITDTMGVPRIWDPAAGPPNGLAPIGVQDMLFCAGHTLMPDGRLMVNGGHHRDDAGINTTYFFSEDGAPQQGPNMAFGRWYPTLTVLSDGRVLSMAGRDVNGNIVTIPEIWENNQWVQLPGAGNLRIPYYPRNYVAPNGLIFYAGERITSRWFNVDASNASGRGLWSNGPTHIWRFNRDYGTAAMYETGKILYAGGGGDPNWDAQSPDDPISPVPTATAEHIDLNQPSAAWQSAGSMSVPRRHLNSTILPDGQVLITGGTTGAGFVNISEALAVKTAEVWNPKTNQWTTLAANQKMRVYHSVSLLLPDGTVLHGASGDADAAQPGGGIVPVPPENNHEIFSPPYMFKGARPAISSAPTQVGYSQVFSIATPNAAQVTEVRWIRLGSVTHAFDMGARANTLRFARSQSGVEVTAPDTPNHAPPGHYMLFILNRNGVPSQGKIIRIG